MLKVVLFVVSPCDLHLWSSWDHKTALLFRFVVGIYIIIGTFSSFQVPVLLFLVIFSLWVREFITKFLTLPWRNKGLLTRGLISSVLHSRKLNVMPSSENASGEALVEAWICSWTRGRLFGDELCFVSPMCVKDKLWLWFRDIVVVSFWLLHLQDEI